MEKRRRRETYLVTEENGEAVEMQRARERDGDDRRGVELFCRAEVRMHGPDRKHERKKERDGSSVGWRGRVREKVRVLKGGRRS